MDTQTIDDQLELLRLKELFMSNIDIRSKMAMFICEEANLRIAHRTWRKCLQNN